MTLRILSRSETLRLQSRSEDASATLKICTSQFIPMHKDYPIAYHLFKQILLIKLFYHNFLW
jgi:hypothetical protein